MPVVDIEEKLPLASWAWDSVGFLRGVDGEVVCDDGSANGEYPVVLEPNSPNGRLIAMAPELLGACVASLSYISCLDCMDNTGNLYIPDGTHEVVSLLESVIARATSLEEDV